MIILQRMGFSGSIEVPETKTASSALLRRKSGRFLDLKILYAFASLHFLREWNQYQSGRVQTLCKCPLSLTSSSSLWCFATYTQCSQRTIRLDVLGNFCHFYLSPHPAPILGIICCLCCCHSSPWRPSWPVFGNVSRVYFARDEDCFQGLLHRLCLPTPSRRF